MFYGLILLAALSFIYFLSIGTVFYGFAVTLPEMIQAFSWSRTQGSLGFSIIGASLGLSGPIVAMLIKRLGARTTILIGGLIVAIGTLGVYFSNSLWQFYLSAGLFLGFGLALQTIIPGSQVISNWFARRRALALGFFMSSGGLGAFIVSPLFAAIMEATGSWRVIWLIMTATALGSSLIGYLLVRDHPADKGAFIDGIDPADSDTTESSRGETGNRRVHQTMVQWQVGDALRTASFWIIVVGASLVALGGSLVQSQSLLHLQDLVLFPLQVIQVGCGFPF